MLDSPVTVSSIGVSVPERNTMGAWLVNRPPPVSAMGTAASLTEQGHRPAGHRTDRQVVVAVLRGGQVPAPARGDDRAAAGRCRQWVVRAVSDRVRVIGLGRRRGRVVAGEEGNAQPWPGQRGEVLDRRGGRGRLGVRGSRGR